MPMATVVLLLIAGIVAAHYWGLSTLVWCGLLALFAIVSGFISVGIVPLLFALGGMVYSLHSYQPIAVGSSHKLIIKITDEGIDYSRYSTYSADVMECDGIYCRARVRVTADSLVRLQSGDILALYGKIRPFEPADGGYARSMYRQGYSGRVTVTEDNSHFLRLARRETLHHYAIGKLKSLVKPSDGRDVAISLSLGAKSISSTTLKQKYSYSGVSHLLAVSGLHVGLVAMLINLLFLPLVSLWRGNIIRSGVVVAFIWLYVALCGYPTSAIRAAIMFSVLQLSHISRSRYSPENSLFAAAFIMLIVEPTMLFEIAFQLSFIAVMAIVFVGAPLNRMLGVRIPLLRGVVSGLVISLVCVVATAPLISHTFGVVSVLSIFVTPVALVTTQIIIISSLLALILPTSAAEVVMRAAEWCGTVQNRIVEWSVSPKIGFAEYQIGEGMMIAIYVVMVLIVVLSFGCKITHDKKDESV